MTISQITHKLEQLEASMVPPKPMRPRITVVYIGADGRPTGEVKCFPSEEGDDGQG
jgi:hypothetical protein